MYRMYARMCTSSDAVNLSGPEVVGGTKWSELSVGIIMIDWNCISCSRLST